MVLQQTLTIPKATKHLSVDLSEPIPAGTVVFRLEWIKPPEKPKKDAAWVNPLKGRAKALGSKLSLDRFMEMQEADKKLDDGTLITDEVADKLVLDVYTALEKEAYRVIPNPHGKTKPLQLSEQRRTALLHALASDG